LSGKKNGERAPASGGCGASVTNDAMPAEKDRPPADRAAREKKSSHVKMSPDEAAKRRGAPDDANKRYCAKALPDNGSTPRDDRICNNVGLVHACARRFLSRGVEYDDLFQAGCVGLIKAADGFDESRGLKFSTYAVPVILGEIRRLFREGGTVKISRSLKELSMRTVRARDSFLAREGHEPTMNELAALLGIETEAAAEALCAAMPALSLTRGGEEEDGDEIDVPVDAPEERVTDRLALRQLLESLAPADRELMVCRYVRRLTQQQTAERLGMSQVQVSRKERALLMEMREKLTSA